MTGSSSTVGAVLDKYGQTFCSELAIPIERNTPAPLFRWLCAATLMSARISTEAATNAARALSEAGWTTPRKMADSTWSERTRVLNRSGYARYDESTSRMLGESCDFLISRYHGDLRRLREAAGRDTAAQRRLIKEFKGIGETGADIFFRELQAVWHEHYPFADKRALKAARRLGLGEDAKTLASLTDRKDFPRLVTALVRLDLANDYDRVESEAA